ncbi:MAG: hypothetical protein IBJ12_09580 [Sphingomonadaceae bacterium]|nr:hypothetical protein [Sphingomonadaceae bacterium]
MKIVTVILLATCAAASPQFAIAKSKAPVFVEAKPVKDTPSVALDPAKAYILLRTPGAMPMHFVKIPNAEDQIAYDKLKAEAFAEVKEDYAKDLAKYERDMALAKKTKGMKEPKKPIEPTETNFQFTRFEQMANFTMGPLNRFYSKNGSTYLHAVTPGRYRIFGQFDPLVGIGVCYCMGSVSFDAEAGKITDLGTMTTDLSNAGPPEKGDSSSPRAAAYAMALEPVKDSTGIDVRLKSLSRNIADLRAAGKMANYYGIAISRLPAIPGVISYRRDQIIDKKALVADPAPTPVEAEVAETTAVEAAAPAEVIAAPAP